MIYVGSFIETAKFPVKLVNEASAREKQGGGRPPHWEMVFWWTRKPLAGARAVVAGALIPGDASLTEFIHSLRLAGGVAHSRNPSTPQSWRERISRARLLDPFAGFGSIPLEAIRLGVGEVVAVELLPTAYIFLKAVLEYPKWAVDNRVSQKLIKDVERWGEWVSQRLKEDPEIRELYDEDVAVYIGTWEARCPHCRLYTPLVGNWWLARVSGRSGGEGGEEEESGRGEYERLAWMDFERAGEEISIRIVDLNRELGARRIRAVVDASRGVVEAGGRRYSVPQKNVDARRESASCLHCGNQIGKLGGEWYVKKALREWNQNLEKYLSGEISLEILRKSPARPTLLTKVKITNNNLEFEPASREDVEKLWKALEKLRTMWGDPDIPTEPIPEYESRSIWVLLYGFNRFFKLFNPRQLLTLVKLVKLIREAGKKIEEEKLKEGWDREKAFKYSEAITTYLAIALIKYADYSSFVAGWNQSLIMGHSLSMRGLAMIWNYNDMTPWASWTGTFLRNLNTLYEGLSYLVSSVSGSSSRVRVLLDDATSLNKLADEKFDLIVTDPPYRDDVAYAELSDFYYVWLKRALSDGNLETRFHREALMYNTQWESLAPQEISYSEGRLKYFGIGDGIDYYRWLLSRAFKRMSSAVKDGGLIVTYFAHSNPEAWIELVEAGWRGAGLMITRAWALISESDERVMARGKTSLESSIVVAWRARDGGRVAGYSEARERARQRAREALENAEKIGLGSLDLLLAVMTACLSEFTSYDKVVRFGGELSSSDIVAESYRIAVEVLVGEESRHIKSADALAYITIRRLFARLPGWGWSLSSQDIITLGYGLHTAGEGEAEKLDEMLTRNRIVVKTDGNRKGAKVTKPSKFIFLSPRDSKPDSIKEVLSLRKIDLVELGVFDEGKAKPLTTSIDVLHILEYAVHRGIDYFKDVYSRLMVKYPTLTEEAIYVAKALSRIVGDPEADLCRDIIRNIYGG